MAAKAIPSNSETDRVLERLRSISEIELHKKIVIPILKSMSTSHLRYVHGSFERGKDLIYIARDAFGQQCLTVCQVKSEQLTGKSGAKSAAAAVLNQLMQCRKVSVLNPITNVKELPQSVVFVTTYPLPDAALADANHLLNEVRAVCTIVTPEKLVELLRLYLPAEYAEFAFPGKNVNRAVRRYVSIHHEAAAFDLTQVRDIGDFYVGIGISPANADIGQMLSGRVKVRRIHKQAMHTSDYESLNSLYAEIKKELKGRGLFTKSRRPPNPEDLPKSEGSSPAIISQFEIDDPSDNEELEPIHPSITRLSSNPVDYTALSEIHFQRFLKEVGTFAKQYSSRKMRGRELNRRHHIAGRVLDVLGISSDLIECLTDRFHFDIENVAGDTDSIQSEDTVLGFRELHPGSLVYANDHYCLLGHAGAGKTCFARTLALSATDQGIDCIYFPCSRIQDRNASLVTEVKDFIRSIGATSETKADALIRRTQLLILDGCDEAASFGRELGQQIERIIFPRRIVENVRIKQAPWIPRELGKHFTVRYTRSETQITLESPLRHSDFSRLIAGNRQTPFVEAFELLRQRMQSAGPRILLTVRDPTPLGMSRSVRGIRMLPFDDAQLKEFYNRWFRNTRGKSRDVLKFLNGNEHIKEICRIPMNATIVAALHENQYDLPRSRTEIYEKRFDLLLSRWDRMRKVQQRTGINPNDKIRFLSRLALWLHRKHRRRFTSQNVRRLWMDGFSREYPQLEIDDVMTELRLIDNVIFPEGGQEFSLGHLSFQEYLAARGVVYGQHIETLCENYADPWWHQTLVFYAGIADDLTKLFSALSRDQALVNFRGLLDQMMRENRYTSNLLRTVMDDLSGQIPGSGEEDEYAESANDQL